MTAAPNREFLLGDLHQLPLPDSCVDLVVSGLALSHVPTLAPVMAEFARVLRPGGCTSRWVLAFGIMALRPDEFYHHAVAAADSEHRLPLARMTDWDISPFEPDGLRVAPLRPPVLPEPARHGQDPSECGSCRDRDEGIWFHDRWRLTRVAGAGVPLVLMLHPLDHYDLADLPDDLAAELGVLTAHIARHIQALAHVSRAHVYRVGDGGVHLHIWFFARPEGQAQLYGSWMVIWDDLLPAYPADVAEADAAAVADALVASYGGSRSATSAPPLTRSS